MSIPRLLFLFLLLPLSAWSQITFHITSLPSNTPAGDDVYLAGTPNNWSPADVNSIFQVGQGGDLWYTLPAGSGTIEFKFTRGSWASVEGNASGGFLPNRTYTYGNGDTVDIDILSWEDLGGGGGGGGGGTSTANAQVSVWNNALHMPQLGRSRRIWVYLPQDYNTTTQDYPVLYMHDGQNVFDASTSFIGEWEVDETLTQLENEGHRSAIVVAIDNGGVHRIDEYSPFVNPQYGGGDGDDYLDFIIQTLKPKIDSAFRTLSGPENTGIMGSSMGGLISHYAYFRNPEVFGKVGIFSPAYWFSDQYFSYTVAQGKVSSPRMYLLAGGLESASIFTTSQQMEDTLISLGYNSQELKSLFPSDGEHSEWFWAREFEDAFKWMFPDTATTVGAIDTEPRFSLYPNPASDFVMVNGEGPVTLEVWDGLGRQLHQTQLEAPARVSLDFLPNAPFVLIRLRNEGYSRAYKLVLRK